MSSDIDLGEIRRVLRHELVAIRGQWAWLLALGIVLVVVGTIAIGMPLLTTLATALTIGVLLLLGGVAQLVGAFWTRDWSGFFLMLLMGVLYIVLGLLFVRQPIAGCRGPDPALGLYPHGQRCIPDRRIADAPVSAMGLDLLGRRPQPGSGRHDLAAVAVLWLLGHRPVRGNRHALQWLDMDYAGLTTQEPAQGPHGHHGLMDRHGKVDRRKSRLGPAPVLSSLPCLNKL